jgi:DNA-directed RNA polymerase subunit RPC12/RpoP
MARTHYVRHAQQRYRTVPVMEDGKPKVVPVKGRDGTQKTTKGGRPISRRVTVEDKSQPLPNYRCTRCGTEIKVGDPYKWFQLRIGTMKQRKNFCGNCTPRQSDMTTSGNLQALYSTIEAAEDALGSLDRSSASLAEIASVLTEAADGVREVSEAYGESADAMEDAFGHETSTSEGVREKAEQLEQFADDLESAASDVEGMEDPDDVNEESVDTSDLDDEPEEPQREDYPDGEDGHIEFDEDMTQYHIERERWEIDHDQAVEDRVEEEKDRLREAAFEAAEEALGNTPM